MRPATLPLLLVLATLGGCGLKDDLYLPPPKPVSAPSTQQGPTDERDEEARTAGAPSPGTP